METRTKIIISGIILLVIGLPVLFFIQLARGFSSSAGEYYRIVGARIAVLSNGRVLEDHLKFI